MTLLKQQAKQEWRSLLVWALAMGGLLLWMLFLYRSMGSSMDAMEEMVKSFPEGVRALYGGNVSLKTVNGFIQGYGFGSWIWIPGLIYTGMFALSITTREMDRRTMEFLLALPVNRREVIASRWTGMALSLLLLHVAHFLAIWSGVLAIGEVPETGRYLVATVNLFLMYLAIGSLLMVIDIFIDDYGRGVGINLGIAVGMFFVYLGTEQATGVLKSLRALLPVAFFDAGAIIGQGLVPWSDMAVLTGISLVCLVLGIILFERKQIAV